MKKTITKTKQEIIEVCDICRMEIGPWSAEKDLHIPNPDYTTKIWKRNTYFVHDICAGQAIKAFLAKLT